MSGFHLYGAVFLYLSQTNLGSLSLFTTYFFGAMVYMILGFADEEDEQK